MMYPAQAEREQVLWMPLLEALDHIQSVENSDSVVAQVRIKLRIGCQVIPVKWADADGPNDKPNVRKLQRSQLVLSGSGLALSGLSLRPLLVLRSAVQATWPQTTTTAAAPSEAHSNASIISIRLAADEKYEEWMSLVEAIEHIRMSQHCDSVEALRQLKREMGDGMVGVQWENSRGLKDHPDPKYLQSSQLLLIGTGFAPDNVREMYRPLLVERSAMQKLWPLSSHRHQRRRLSTAKASKAQIRKTLKEIYADPSSDSPNVNKAWDLLAARLPTARRKLVMDILKEPEFATQRRSAGKPPSD